jgi:pyrroline-5-carboxylate reductase
MKVGFAGAGNMAAAMARGWAAGDGGPEAMAFVDLDRDRADALAAEVGGTTFQKLAELAEASDLVVLAVKPSELDVVASEFSPPALLSVLAATSLARLDQAFPGVPTIRVMPNQPVEVRAGVICHPPPANMGEELSADVQGLLSVLGTVIEMDEEKIDAAMALMSCSPAYVADVAEALIDAGREEGLEADVAKVLVADTFAGTAKLLRKRDPAEIRRAVAPPGGATEAGLEALVRFDVRAAFTAAVNASLERFR